MSQSIDNSKQASDREPALSRDSCWQLVGRVIGSPKFQRAGRLRELLLFVCRQTLYEGREQVHEQEIGAAVFGRKFSYDTGADNIVRVNATELRRRLEAYFQNEGATEPVVLEIPRGSYKPIFRMRTIETGGREGAAETVGLDGRLRESSGIAGGPAEWLWLGVLSGVIVVLALVCVSLWMEARSLRRALYGWEQSPALRSFWTGFLTPQSRTDVILADTSFSLIEDITRRPISLNDYLTRKYVSGLQSRTLSADRRADLGMIEQRSYGSVGDFRVAQHLLALDPLGKLMHLYYAREYEPSQVKDGNLILIGSRKSNPWVDLFATKLNFNVEYDPERQVSYISNRQPQAGEPALYRTPSSPVPGGGYSVVAYLPNPDQAGKVLIVEGTGSEATEGAGEFVTSENQLNQFRALLHTQQLPYFELLLKTSHLNGTPLQSTIVAYRSYSKP